MNVSARRTLEITLGDLNADPRYMVPNVTFALVWADSGGTLHGTVKAGVELATSKGVVALIGEYSSARTEPLALAMNSFGVYQCSVASSPDLSDKTDYQYFYRTVPSDLYQGIAIMSLVQKYGWSKIALMTVSSSYGFGIASSILAYASATNITVLRNEAFNPGDRDYALQVSSIVESDARVIVIIGYDSDVISILREARRQGLVSPDHVYIGTDAVEPMYGLLYGAETSSAYTDRDRQNIEGMIYSTFFENGGGAERADLERRYSALYGDTPMTYSYFIRDCLLSMSYGVKRLLAMGHNLDAIRSRSTGVSVKDFIATDFNGSSGFVHFDGTGDRMAGYTFSNVVNGKLVDSLTFDQSNAFTTLAKIVFNGGSTIPPPDSKRVVLEVINYGSPVSAFLIAGYMVMGGVCVGTAGVLVWKRNTTLVKTMSLPFLLLTVLGLLVGCTAIFGWVGNFEKVPSACRLQQWWGMFFGNDDQCAMQEFGNTRLLLTSLPITLINILILAIWTGVDAPKSAIVVLAESATYHYECRSDSSLIQAVFVWLLFAYNLVLLLLTMALAFATRNVASEYKETIYVFYFSQNILICGSVVLVVTEAFGVSYVPSLYVKAALFLLSMIFIYVTTIGRVAVGSFHSDPVMSKSDYLKVSKLGGGTKDGKFLASSPMLDATPGALSAEYDICVKNGNSMISFWEKRRVVFMSHKKLILFIDNKKEIGDVIAISKRTLAEDSMIYPDCINFKHGQLFKLLQFTQTEAKDTFLELVQANSLRANLLRTNTVRSNASTD
ncbi:hypothetical protein HK101_000292 [Irineochytrium annulatum]|nr:hypothetical protein HK101_000292 [Irineochytrium annulatum]